MAAPFPSLAALSQLPLDSSGPLRICIVTPDLLGPVKNGGIGTACGYLAEALAKGGHETWILFCQAGAKDIETVWIEEYAAKGIKAVNAAALQTDQLVFPALPQLYMAKTVYDWLREQPDYDLILFMDWQASGFYAIHARKAGIAFQNTAMAVIIHSPTYWHSINNASIAANPVEALIWHMERTAIAMADAVISPSNYMLHWTAERLCKLPAHAYMQPNLLNWNENVRHTSNKPVKELVFFGRLEFRKGLEQFCSAMDDLAKMNCLPKKITFLGKCSWMGEEHSLFYITRRAANWQCEINLEIHKGHAEAVKYICGAGRMAIMPSIADNSPYTVYECIVAGVPFLARNVGGIGEFLPPAQQQDFLFNDNPHELAEKIKGCLSKPPKRASLAFNRDKLADEWLASLPRLASLLQHQSTNPKAAPLISVILTHYNRPELLAKALDSLLNQTYQNFELILADDGSTAPEALAYLDSLQPLFFQRGWKILHLPNGHAAAARNRGAEVASGDWLLFFDDDNIAMPRMLEKAMMVAQHLDLGYVPFMFQVFSGNGLPDSQNEAEIFLPTGSSTAYGCLVNTLSDTCALIHRDTFKTIGGFREDYGIGHEDFELFLRLALGGHPCHIIPEPMFWYRVSPQKSSVQLNTNATLNRMRSLRPFLELLPPHLAELALMTHSMGKHLHLYPEPDAELLCDIPLDRNTDPNDEEILTKAAHILASNGAGKYATQLFRHLPDESPEKQLNFLLTRAMTAARAADLSKLHAILADFDRLSLPRGDIAPLADIIFENLQTANAPLRTNILSRIEQLENKDTLASLLLAEAKAQDSNMDESARLLIQALSAADQEYLSARPDVLDAIKAKAFISGLHHFLLHGLIDRTSWPQRPVFSRIFKRYPDLIPAVVRNHMIAWKCEDETLSTQLIGALITGYLKQTPQDSPS